MISIDETDLGTPARESKTLVTLSIDDREVTVPAGTSVMRAAALAGTSITIGLRDLVPQYLHRLGMELEWAHNLGFNAQQQNYHSTSGNSRSR